MSIQLQQSSQLTYTTSTRVMHVREPGDHRSVECETSLVLTCRVGDSLGHACSVQWLIDRCCSCDSPNGNVAPAKTWPASSSLATILGPK